MNEPLDPTRKAFLVLLDLAEWQGWPEGESELHRGSVESVVNYALRAPEGAAVARVAGLDLRFKSDGTAYPWNWPLGDWLPWAHEEIARRHTLLSAAGAP